MFLADLKRVSVYIYLWTNFENWNCVTSLKCTHTHKDHYCVRVCDLFFIFYLNDYEFYLFVTAETKNVTWVIYRTHKWTKKKNKNQWKEIRKKPNTKKRIIKKCCHVVNKLAIKKKSFLIMATKRFLNLQKDNFLRHLNHFYQHYMPIPSKD